MHNSKFSSSLKCFMPLHFPSINEEHDLGALLCSLVFFFCCLNNKVTAVEIFLLLSFIATICVLNIWDTLSERKNTVIKAAHEQTHDVSAPLHTGSLDALGLATPPSTAAASSRCQYGRVINPSTVWFCSYNSNSHCGVTRKVGWCWLGSIRERDACCRKVLQWSAGQKSPAQTLKGCSRSGSISLTLALSDSTTNSSLQCSTS